MSKPNTVIIAVLLCLAASTAPASPGLRTVALTGQHAPGTPIGVSFSNFGLPALNDAGQTAFFATLAGETVVTTNNRGIWSEGSSSLALVVRTGSQAADLPNDVAFSDFRPPRINNAGQTAFWARVTNGGQGIWTDRTGSLEVIAHTGSQLPDTPEGRTLVEFFETLSLNNSGQVAFHPFLMPNDSGIWSEGSGSLARVALSRTQVPGMPDGDNFGHPSPPAFNDSGQTAFTSIFGGATTGGQGVFLESAGSMSLIATTGSQAPGAPAGAQFIGFDLPVVNSLGQTAFKGRVSPGGSNYGIWSDGTGTLRAVALSGDQAPGMPSGTNFFIFDLPLLNNAGQTVFEGRYSGAPSTSNRGIWLEGPNGLELVARSGIHAAGTPDGVVYRDNSSNPLFSSLVLNDAGQVAFHAILSGVGVDSTNSAGIWATDRSGFLQLIARTGDLLEVAPGDVRTISGLGFQGNTGNSDGRPCGFNNVGQLAFHAVFTDGSRGIFISNLVAIPEPSSLLLVTLCLFAAAVAARSRYRI